MDPYAALRPLLFRFEPETAHRLTLAAMQFIQAVPGGLPAVRHTFGAAAPSTPFTWRGLQFPSRVGVAAGLDKNGRVVRFLEAIGAGFVEVGTVTPRPQPGNPRPRVFRFPRDEALVNRLGFPSEGMERVVSNLRHGRPVRIPVGLNLGKNASTPLDQAVDDYLACLVRLHEHGDYFVANISSPNTPGLRSLQDPASLATLLGSLVQQNRSLKPSPKPLFLKVSADLTGDDLDDVVSVCLDAGIDGLVAVNTSTDDALRSAASRDVAGGLSGPPIFNRALAAVSRIRQRVPDDFFLFGVGGVASSEDVQRMLDAGANAVQVYTGLVYRGPRLFTEAKRA